MKPTLRALVALCASPFGALAGGCGDTSGAGAPTLSFLAAPYETVGSSSGHLHVEVRWSPAAPEKGADAAQLTVLDDLGAPVDGLAMTVVPWMPAHGHGTSVQPTTVETATGVLVATPIYLFMSGEWQLRITMTGAVSDSAVATAQIP